MKCPNCGAAMRPKTVREYDVADLFGLTRVVVQNLPLIACTKCEHVLLPGRLVEALGRQLVESMLQANFPLGGCEIRFLRKSVRLTQEQLAERLGVDRVTVARWEGRRDEEPISMPESIAIRMVIVASGGETSSLKAPPSSAYRAPPVRRPSGFRLDPPTT